jgi:class 3 adenylate cyclase
VRPQQEQRVERRLAAIFAANVAGYSRLMSQDEAGTLRALAAAREVMDGLLRSMGGESLIRLEIACWPSSRGRLMPSSARWLSRRGLGRSQPMHLRIGVFIFGSASTLAM